MKSLLREYRQNADLEAASAQIRRRFREHPLWESARIIGLFAALPEEPDLVPLLQEVSLETVGIDKQFVFPVIRGDGMIWQSCGSESELVAVGPPGRLREPVEGVEVPVEAIDLIAVPGLAFARGGGQRLGRGGGYYDRALAQRREAGRTGHVGVCFSFQLVDALPTEPHDQSVECVIYA
jgi:5-formyltetrahydrofolate cyclo-ligase